MAIGLIQPRSRGFGSFGIHYDISDSDRLLGPTLYDVVIDSEPEFNSAVVARRRSVSGRQQSNACGKFGN